MHENKTILEGIFQTFLYSSFLFWGRTFVLFYLKHKSTCALKQYALNFFHLNQIERNFHYLPEILTKFTRVKNIKKKVFSIIDKAILFTDGTFKFCTPFFKQYYAIYEFKKKKLYSYYYHSIVWKVRVSLPSQFV